MVFRAVGPNSNADLFNEENFFGYFGDTIYVLPSPTGGAISILTYRGNDLVDARDGHADNTLSIQTGLDDDTVLGGAAGEVLYDMGGNDRYLMGAGADFVFGSYGNDTLDGGAGVDILTFEMLLDDGGAEISANVAVRIDLAIKTAQDTGAFGRDVILNFEHVTGSEANDTLSGNGQANDLLGRGGNDQLTGRGGADNLAGSDGADTLTGGVGGDILYLGASDGATDVVRFVSLRDSGLVIGSADVDLVHDFVLGQDTIDLQALDARPSTAANDAFLFRGTGAFSSAKGEVRVEYGSGVTRVYVDTDSDAAAEMVFEVSTTGLAKGDFIL